MEAEALMQVRFLCLLQYHQESLSFSTRDNSVKLSSSLRTSDVNSLQTVVHLPNSLEAVASLLTYVWIVASLLSSLWTVRSDLASLARKF